MRVGSVPYLNAKPLVWGLGGVTFAEPSALARGFDAGDYDVALVPVFDCVTAKTARVADDVSISCRGRVYSVIVASPVELAKVKRIALDPASHTSNHLARCLLAEFYDFAPEFTVDAADESPDAGRLLIGDNAIRFRSEHPGWRILDLGQAWWRWTGLPFVFACWRIAESHPDPEAVAGTLREIKRAGMWARRTIAATQPDPAFAHHYLTRFIHYDLGDDEKAAIDLFGHLVRKHGFADPASASAIRFV